MVRTFPVDTRIALLLAFELLVTTFAGAPQKPVTLGVGEKELTLKADSLYFEPNCIKANRGDILTIWSEATR